MFKNISIFKAWQCNNKLSSPQNTNKSIHITILKMTFVEQSRVYIQENEERLKSCTAETFSNISIRDGQIPVSESEILVYRHFFQYLQYRYRQ